MVLLFLFAFISGLVTILAPCIWPLLPIILSTSVAGRGRFRPLGITLGIVISFASLTLAISFFVRAFHFDPNILRLVSVVVIGFLGLTMVLPPLSRLMESMISRLTSFFGQNQRRKGEGLTSGFLTGISLGVIWSPCAGPILATVATLSAMGEITLGVVAVMLAYVAGVGMPLFIFVYGGQRIINRSQFFSTHTKVVQQIFGVVMILTAVAIYTNYDKYLQVKLLNAFPIFGTSLNGFESNKTVTQQLDILKGKVSLSQNMESTDLFNENINAPDFSGITKWLNLSAGTESLSLRQLRGKVVLVDFWTYTCINCLRTLPFVTSWYEKYKDQGFVVVGVHTPEFEFEKDTNNVRSAIKQYNIHYPVAQDNNYGTWNNYANQYWPAEYLIDASGKIRRTHFGEGEYDKMELAIQALLKDSGQKVNRTLSNMPDQTPQIQLSPETYLGSKRMAYYFPNGGLDNGLRDFNLSENLPRDSFSLGGRWKVDDESVAAGQGAVINYNFYANKVFLVMRPGGVAKGRTKVFLDGQEIMSSVSGQDVKDGVLVVDSDRLYGLVDLRGNPGIHLLRLEFETEGIEVFAFTFG